MMFYAYTIKVKTDYGTRFTMCFERLVHLKCGHFESYRLDKGACKYKGARSCPEYIQAVVQQDKSRSCIKCKAMGLTTLGVASPSLRLL